MKTLNFSKGGIINDRSFLYIEWTDQDNPDYNTEIQDIINDIDSEFFYDSLRIDDTLPFLTFKQGEILFKTLRDRFGTFTFSMVSLANDEGGRPSIELEPKLKPFIIDSGYTEIMTPLMESALIDDELRASYPYQVLNSYFTDLKDGVLSIYAESVGLSQSQLPFFPSERYYDDIKNSHEVKRESANQIVEQKKILNPLLPRIALGIGIFGIFIGLAGVTVGIYDWTVSNKISKQTRYLYDELKKEKENDDKISKADVFARYFMSAYFSGDKQKIVPFLSGGDARYTQPGKAEVVISSLLETKKILKDGSISLGYVISLKDEEGNYRNLRLSFEVLEQEDTNFGFIVTSEPITSNYGSNVDEE